VPRTEELFFLFKELCYDEISENNSLPKKANDAHRKPRESEAG